MTAVLIRGANAPLRADGQPVPRVRVEIAWQRIHAGRDAVLLAVACDLRGQAISPAHHVTFRAPTAIGSTARFEIFMDLEAVPATGAQVSFALATESGSVQQLGAVTATVRTEDGQELARYAVEDSPDWPALVVAEVYRRSGQWKVRAIGHGLADGYAGLLRSFALTG
ncbi:TerD family protein [Geodermatophilus sp. SYSU D00691]